MQSFTSFSPKRNAVSSSVARPGISPEFLAANSIRVVDADEAFARCGLREPGIIIPYRECKEGKLGPLHDPADHPYARLRRFNPTADHKYHQPAGTSVHAYLPVNILDGDTPEGFPKVEGELKAASNSDKHQGFWRPTIGLSGLFGFHLGRSDGEEPQLVPELETILRLRQPRRILYIGDNDTAFNYDFFVAVVRLKQMLNGLELALPRIPLNEPKGLDDCRQEHGAKYERFYQEIVHAAIQVEDDALVDALALQVAIPALNYLPGFTPDVRAAWNERIIKFAARLPDTYCEAFLQAAKKPTGIGTTALRKCVQARRDELRRARDQQLADRVRPLIQDFFLAGNCYYRRVADGFKPLPTRNDVLLELRLQKGLTGAAMAGETEDTFALNLIQREQHAGWAGELAGHAAGVHGEGGNRFLVLNGPKLVSPRADGDASLIVELLAELMGVGGDEPYGRHQFRILVALLAQRLRALRNPAAHLPSPILVLVGEHDIGKDLVVRHIITPLLGGRDFDPTPVWAGLTPFNDGVIGAEHLHLHDPEVPLDDKKGLARFQSELLKVVTGEERPVLAKFMRAQFLRPVQSVTITMNPTTQAFALLPLRNRHVDDKLILIRCHALHGLPDQDPSARTAILNRIMAALPAFVGQLEAFRPPADLQDRRLGVVGFRHPALVALAGVSDVSGELAQRLDQFIGEMSNVDGWRGSARELHGALEQRLGKLYTDRFGDARSLGKGLVAVRRDVPGWQKRIVEDGRVPYGDQGNYATVWRITRPSVVGS